jgi:hypothetical protein
MISIPWWAETDRRKLQQACEVICQEQGILTVVGNEFAGRGQAAWIAERALDKCGCAIVIYKLNSQRANNSRDALRELASIAEKLQPPVPGSISVDVTANSYTDSGLFEVAEDELRRFHQADGKPLGVLVYDLDETVPNACLTVFRRLADRLGGAWVLVGSQKVNWNRLQPKSRHALKQFERDDVAKVLRSAVEGSIVSTEAADGLLQNLYGAVDRKPAIEVYSALKLLEVGLVS